MNPKQLFNTIGDQLGEITSISNKLRISGYEIQEFTLETQFEVNSSLDQTTLPTRQSFLDGNREGPLFRVKIVIH